MGHIVNKREVAEVFGVSPQAVDGWLSRGCPYVEKGAPGVGYQFNTATVAEWRQEQAVLRAIGDNKPDDQDDAEFRKLSAEASLAELKLARERGQLVTIDDIGKVWTRAITSLRTRILSIPSKVATLVIGATSPEEVRACLDEEINEALNELADGIGDDSPDGDDSAEPGGPESVLGNSAAPKAQPERVVGGKSQDSVRYGAPRKIPGRKRRVPAGNSRLADGPID